MSLSNIPLRHIPPLLIGTMVTVMSTPTYFNVPWGMRLFGLPNRIADAPSAQSAFVLYTSRIQSISALILIFYAKGDYAAVDTVMSMFGFMGTVDVYLCVKEGIPDKALLRGVTSALVALWGWYGMTVVSC
jgi:hypothetical protein